MSHEVSITIEMDGRFFVIPSVVDGKKVSLAMAEGAFRAGHTQALIRPGGFDTEAEANAAARERSDFFGRALRTRGLRPNPLRSALGDKIMK